jgi:hypothetical protein
MKEIFNVYKIPNKKISIFEISEFEIKNRNENMELLRLSFSRRGIKPGKYKRLLRGTTLVMSNTPAELNDAWNFIRQATGNVLINGLGLGAVLSEILKKEEVTKVTIIEKHKEVIELVQPYINDERVNIIHCDCFEYHPPKNEQYDIVWHDIWDYICSDNIPEMKKLHRKYGKRAKKQLSWCREECERLR